MRQKGDTVNAFSVILIIAGVCGFTMVLGGIVLLYKGAIKLSSTPRDKAVELEFQRVFKITTQYPALGIFIIGLAFVTAALVTSRPRQAEGIVVKGKADAGPLTSVVVQPGPWYVETTLGNGFDGVIHPDVSKLYLELTAPGSYGRVSLDVHNGVADVGTIRLAQAVSQIPSDPANIEPLPAGFQPPALSAQGSFGAGNHR